MIQAKELRIGNKVTDEFYPHFKRVLTVNSINDKGINLYVQDDGKIPECASNWVEPENTFYTLFPIPFTKDILRLTNLKIITHSNDINNIEGDNYLALINNIDDGYISNSLQKMLTLSTDTLKDFKVFFLGKEIKYLHELQNIVFILSGEEIKINF